MHKSIQRTTMRTLTAMLFALAVALMASPSALAEEGGGGAQDRAPRLAGLGRTSRRGVGAGLDGLLHLVLAYLSSFGMRCIESLGAAGSFRPTARTL